jgi:HAD superfamily hydrolase (TIGR01509 family)
MPASVEPRTAPIQALIFDMDGLLVDSEPLADAAMVEFLRRHGKRAREEYAPQLLGRRLPDAVALFMEWYGLEGEIGDLTSEFDALRTEMIIGNLALMPGASEIIAFARDAGLRLGLATSNRRHQAVISLAETGLTGQFDAEVSGDDVSQGKPFPEIFLTAARLLGVVPSQCVVLEDAPAGVMAAAAAGMRCVFVPNGYSLEGAVPVSADVTVPTLFEAIDWLRVQGVLRDASLPNSR